MTQFKVTSFIATLLINWCNCTPGDLSLVKNGVKSHLYCYQKTRLMENCPLKTTVMALPGVSTTRVLPQLSLVPLILTSMSIGRNASRNNQPELKGTKETSGWRGVNHFLCRQAYYWFWVLKDVRGTWESDGVLIFKHNGSISDCLGYNKKQKGFKFILGDFNHT